MENKNRLPGIIFTRVWATIGIIIFHYFYHSNSTTKFLYLTQNSDFGYLYVTCFFAISGVVLYYNYPKNFSLKTFYFKRWKAIFPIFYLCWLFWYIRMVIAKQTFFWAGNPLKFIFSLFGIDGYFHYLIPNYYLVGEWFLGALIFIYILYPLLCKCMNKNILIVPVILFLGYILQYTTNFFVIEDHRNLFTCITSFYFGMIAIKYKNLFFKNKIIGLISLILFLSLCFTKIQLPFINQTFIDQIQGLSLFIVLVWLGNYVMETSISSIFKYLDKISFPMFLFQHHIIIVILYFYNPLDIKYVLLNIIFIILITIICAKVVQIITNFILETKIFKKIESKFI